MIGVLAYGSLITDPGVELAAVTVGIGHHVLTPFPVEFARTSHRRCGAPTLVPVEHGGSRVRAIIFEVNVDEKQATDIVYRREINEVGSTKTYIERPAHWKNAVRLDRIKGLEGFDLVISTRMLANIASPSAETLAELAISSAQQLADGRDGISYLIHAKACGIETPLTPAYERAILDRTGAPDLAAAFQAIRLGTRRQTVS